MRNRLIALSALAVMSLATAMPAAAAEQTVNCTGAIGAYTRSYTFSTEANVNAASLSSLAGTSVTLRNGLTVKVVDVTATSFTAQAALPFGLTASVTCKAAPTVY
jgi:hypothetical protein